MLPSKSRVTDEVTQGQALVISGFQASVDASLCRRGNFGSEEVTPVGSYLRLGDAKLLIGRLQLRKVHMDCSSLSVSAAMPKVLETAGAAAKDALVDISPAPTVASGRALPIAV